MGRRLLFALVVFALCLGVASTSQASAPTFEGVMRLALAALPTNFASLRGAPKSATQFEREYASRPGTMSFVTIKDEYATVSQRERWTLVFDANMTPGLTVPKVVSETIVSMTRLAKGYHLTRTTDKDGDVHMLWSGPFGRSIAIDAEKIPAWASQPAHIRLAVTIAHTLAKNIHVAAYAHGISAAQQAKIARAVRQSVLLALSNAATNFSALRGDEFPLPPIVVALRGPNETEHFYKANVAFAGTLYACQIDSDHYSLTEKYLSSREMFKCKTPVFGGSNGALAASLFAIVRNTAGPTFTYLGKDPTRVDSMNEWYRHSDGMEVHLDLYVHRRGTFYVITVSHAVPNGS